MLGRTEFRFRVCMSKVSERVHVKKRNWNLRVNVITQVLFNTVTVVGIEIFMFQIDPPTTSLHFHQGLGWGLGRGEEWKAWLQWKVWLEVISCLCCYIRAQGVFLLFIPSYRLACAAAPHGALRLMLDLAAISQVFKQPGSWTASIASSANFHWANLSFPVNLAAKGACIRRPPPLHPTEAHWYLWWLQLPPPRISFLLRF